jgi:hypothetical protein
MSFGSLFDGGAGGGSGGMQFPYADGFSSSPALSLGLVCSSSRNHSTFPCCFPWRVISFSFVSPCFFLLLILAGQRRRHGRPHASWRSRRGGEGCGRRERQPVRERPPRRHVRRRRGGGRRRAGQPAQAEKALPPPHAAADPGARSVRPPPCCPNQTSYMRASIISIFRDVHRLFLLVLSCMDSCCVRA